MGPHALLLLLLLLPLPLLLVQINLPPSQGLYAMMRCWDELKKAYPVHEHDQLLFKLAQDTTPATLVNMAEGWRGSRGTKTIPQYVCSYHRDKLLAEVSACINSAVPLSNQHVLGCPLP